MPHILKISRFSFVDPSWWRPKNKDDVIIGDPKEISLWREQLKGQADICYTAFRTQLVKECLVDNELAPKMSAPDVHVPSHDYAMSDDTWVVDGKQVPR